MNDHATNVSPLNAIRHGPRRGLSRVESADYVGVSPTKFDEMVADNRMPGPKEIDSRVVWDVRALDIAFDALPDRKRRNTWDR